MAAVIDDGLRPPLLADPTRSAYKEWLHLNIVDHDSGAVALLNVSLHGDPRDRRSVAVGTALLHHPEAGWAGNVAVRPLRAARLGLSSIALPEVAIAVDRAGRVSASAVMPQHQFEIVVEAVAEVRPYEFPLPAPFGSGWISWYVVPRLRVRGRAAFDGRELRFRDAGGYHDHNWGRWHWGDDARWEWGTLLAAGDGASFVFTRATTRRMEPLTAPLLIADTAAGRREFTG